MVLDAGQVIEEALRRMSEDSPTWLLADLARHVATLLPADTASSASELVERIDQLAAQAERRCYDLTPHDTRDGTCRQDGRPVLEHVTDHRLSTTAILEQERDLQRWARTATSLPAPHASDPATNAATAMAGTADLVVVVGPAGTGKTTATAEAVAELQNARRPVIGLAPSGKAADVLAAEANCSTDTVARFLTRHSNATAPRPPAGTTLILDEAGMASTDDLAQLVDLVGQNRWRLVAVGDPNQLPAVGRGGVFAHWCNTIPHIELTAPRRFQNPWEAQASLDLRAGHPDAANTYNRHGRLRSVHPALLPRQIATLHQQQSAAGRTVAVTASSAATARTINQAIQQHNNPHDQLARVALADGTSVGVGDQIATRRNDPHLASTQGHRVRNRHTWTITSIDGDGALAATHPQRGDVTLPANYVARHVELGWAVTGYGNQGDTVDIGIAVLEPGTSRNHAYVAMTRGRTANVAYLPDPIGTHNPAEQLAAIITRPVSGDSALTTHANLRGEHPNTIPPPRTPSPQPAWPRPEPPRPRYRMRM